MWIPEVPDTSPIIPYTAIITELPRIMPLLASSSLLAFLTILLIIQSHAIKLPHKIPVDDLRSKDCAFEFSGERYDLCPLFRGGARRSVAAEVMHGETWRWRMMYDLVFAGGMGGVPADSEPSVSPPLLH